MKLNGYQPPTRTDDPIRYRSRAHRQLEIARAALKRLRFTPQSSQRVSEIATQALIDMDMV